MTFFFKHLYGILNLKKYKFSDPYNHFYCLSLNIKMAENSYLDKMVRE